MTNWRKHLWTVGKIVFTLGILLLVGWQIFRDLQSVQLDDLVFRPGWAVASAVCYLIGLMCAGLFWFRLLILFEQKPHFGTCMRAYYIGHLGKYVPGKAVGLLMRGTLARSGTVNMGVAMITAFYEVLTTMASGAILAAVVFMIFPPEILGLNVSPVFIGGALFVLVGIPLLPAVFNRMVKKMAGRFQQMESLKLPPLKTRTLLEGLFLTGCGWMLLGLSMWCTLQTLSPKLQPFSLPDFFLTWLKLSATVSLAYVAGFLAILVPSGVGVREFFLLRLLPLEIVGLSTDLTKAVAAMAALVIRLIWTVSELVTASILYVWPKIFLNHRDHRDHREKDREESGE